MIRSLTVHRSRHLPFLTKYIIFFYRRQRFTCITNPSYTIHIPQILTQNRRKICSGLIHGLHFANFNTFCIKFEHCLLSFTRMISTNYKDVTIWKKDCLMTSYQLEVKVGQMQKLPTVAQRAIFFHEAGFWSSYRVDFEVFLADYVYCKFFSSFRHIWHLLKLKKIGYLVYFPG